jgi:L-lactate dehydrogenase complex protein LldE
MPETKPLRIGLFVTCLVDFFRPNVGFAVVKTLEAAGCKVAVPGAQTCCGQPAYNSGDRADARRIAAQVIEAFTGFDYIVVPSGSCGGMIKLHYPELFADDPAMAEAARDLAARTHEYVAFVSEVLGEPPAATRYDGVCTYHDSCSSLRELKVKAAPRALLGRIDGVELRELATPEVCCGFGGTFCVKYPDISDRMVTDKTADIVATGADTLVAGDMGCLLNIAGKLRRQGHDLRVFHIAELLAGMADGGGLGGAEG